MAYDPGPEGWCTECMRLVPIAPVPRQRHRTAPPALLAQHRTYRAEMPFNSGPGYCRGSGAVPAAVPCGDDIRAVLP